MIFLQPGLFAHVCKRHIDIISESDNFFVVYPHSDPHKLPTHLYKRELCDPLLLEDGVASTNPGGNLFKNIGEALVAIGAAIELGKADEATLKTRLLEFKHHVDLLPETEPGRLELSNVLQSFVDGKVTMQQAQSTITGFDFTAAAHAPTSSLESILGGGVASGAAPSGIGAIGPPAFNPAVPAGPLLPSGAPPLLLGF